LQDAGENQTHQDDEQRGNLPDELLVVAEEIGKRVDAVSERIEEQRETEQEEQRVRRHLDPHLARMGAGPQVAYRNAGDIGQIGRIQRQAAR